MPLSKNIRMRVAAQSIDKDDLVEYEKKERLKELQQRFLTISKEITKNNLDSIKGQSIIQVNDFKKSKINKDIKQQLSSTNKKLDELREKERKYKEIIAKSKNKLRVKDEELVKETSKNFELNNKTEKYLSKINGLETRIMEIEESYSKKSLNLLINDIKYKDKEIVSKNKKIIQLCSIIAQSQDKINSLKDEVFSLRHGDEISKKDVKYYNQMINSYSNENAKLRKKLAGIEQTYNEKVKRLISSDLLINQLKSEIQIIKEGKNHLKNKTRKFGVLKTINGFVFFEDLEGNLNPANIDNVIFRENAPCKAVIRYNKNNIAVIQKVYNEKFEYLKEIKEKRIIKKKRAEKGLLYEDINMEENYNVLIIGSEKKKEYSSVLKSIGLNVTLYDSYEGNVIRLKNMLNRYDIIICCIRHSRHYASNLMKYMIEHDSSNAIKYNVMDNDNALNIIARVRYIIENL